MDTLEYFRSKVGKNTRIPIAYQLDPEVSERMLRLYKSHMLHSTDSYEYVRMSNLAFEAIQATGDELVNKRGKWTTRFRKEMKKVGISLTDQQLGLVGDTINMLTDHDGPYFVDVTSDLDWSAGDFQDAESCFWTCRVHSRDMMSFYNGLAVRTFRSDTYERGTGRAWLCKPNGLKKDVVVIFNAYGKQLDKFAVILARMASLDGHTLSKREVVLYNDDAEFWVNQNRGFALSLSGDLSDLPDRFSLDFQEIHGRYHWMVNHGGDLPKCEYCGAVVVPNEKFTMIEKMRDEHGELMCPECAQRLGYAMCADCNSLHKAGSVLTDKRGHTFCVSSARWFASLDDAGMVFPVTRGDFRNNRISADSVDPHNYDYRTSKRDTDTLWGPICPRCYQEIDHRSIWREYQRDANNNTYQVLCEFADIVDGKRADNEPA